MKSIASDTQAPTHLTVTCSVEEGCAILDCQNAANAGSTVFTIQPCTDPPSILVEFYNSSDGYAGEVLLTHGDVTLPSEDGTLTFNVTQPSNGTMITLQVS